MTATHTYTVDVTWTGAGHTGTTSYTAYSRDHDISIPGRPVLLGSADPAFRGDPARYSPEQLFVASLSECHMLWFLHLAARDGVVVVGYEDEAVGTMRVESAGAGQFINVVLRPRVTVRLPAADDPTSTRPVTDARLAAVHELAHEHCFVSRSVNFPVLIEPARLTTAD
ncbi:OsmC family protein [Pengzhenrongella frigida]|uniref:OsmC family peroxiredoxin n=1 Tax=Pengzhenrongella frigida TaxID=1259133 RepID=A0A4V1ZH57_9MICO|nr:OsmC family protein [Cellulomonas sp. HLT2-17]RYV50884.1 OsmC family peroxiredoxin [Cellulomonas sp. HLT2-17]